MSITTTISFPYFHDKINEQNSQSNITIWTHLHGYMKHNRAPIITLLLVTIKEEYFKLQRALTLTRYISMHFLLY